MIAKIYLVLISATFIGINVWGIRYMGWRNVTRRDAAFLVSMAAGFALAVYFGWTHA